MARPVTLFTGQWADLPLDELDGKLAAWGFGGAELACWGDHFAVDRAVADSGYVNEKRALLERHGLGCWTIGAHLVGQCVCDPIDVRHKGILPPEVWGDGDPEGVRHGAGGRGVRRRRRHRLHRLGRLAHALLVPAQRLRRDRARLPGVRRALGP